MPSISKSVRIARPVYDAIRQLAATGNVTLGNGVSTNIRGLSFPLRGEITSGGTVVSLNGVTACVGSDGITLDPPATTRVLRFDVKISKLSAVDGGIHVEVDHSFVDVLLTPE